MSKQHAHRSQMGLFACSKRYTLCDSFLLIHLLIFLELLVLPTLHSSSTNVWPPYFTILWNLWGFFDSPVCKPWPMFSSACRWRCGSERMWSLTRRCSCWDSDIYQPRPATSQWIRLWSSRLHEPWSETPPDYSSVQKMIKKLHWLAHITLRNL